MKIRLLLLLLILVVPMTMADVECSNVLVVKFNYNEGIINYRDKVVKCGYAPDRRIQPLEGYTAEMMSMDDRVLYYFKFEVPLKLNVDLTDPLTKSLSGGILILNETDFALIFPYYDDAESIVVYNPRKYKVLEVSLVEEQFIQRRGFWWGLVLLVLLVFGYIIYKIYRNKQRRL